MNSAISDKNIELIKSDIRDLGISYESLLDDILDHICCMVEDEMESGKDFNSSYSDVMDSIDKKQIPDIQHQTLLLLDKKFQKMKNFTYRFGLISTFILLVGAVFKRLHWPGAGILITLGLLFIMFVFLPLYLYGNYKEQSERKSPVYQIVGYITLLFLLAAAMFKIQHWQGAGLIIEIAMAVLMIGFLPLYVANAFQKASKRVNLPYIIMVVVGIVLISFFFHVRMGLDRMESYRDAAVENITVTELVTEKTAGLVKLTDDSLFTGNKDLVYRIHEKAIELRVYAEDLQDELLSSVDLSSLPDRDMVNMDSKLVPHQVLYQSGAREELLRKSKEYAILLEETIDNDLVMGQIRDHIEFTGKVWNDELGELESALVLSYYKLSDVIKGIALSEYVAIAYLLHH